MASTGSGVPPCLSQEIEGAGLAEAEQVRVSPSPSVTVVALTGWTVMLGGTVRGGGGCVRERERETER